MAALVAIVINPGEQVTVIALVVLALLLGLFLVLPIGGADMPVVIALLNSYSGLAAALVGLVLGNTVLIIAGSSGTSGLILTKITCGQELLTGNVLFENCCCG